MLCKLVVPKEILTFLVTTNGASRSKLPKKTFTFDLSSTVRGCSQNHTKAKKPIMDYSTYMNPNLNHTIYTCNKIFNKTNFVFFNVFPAVIAIMRIFFAVVNLILSKFTVYML